MTWTYSGNPSASSKDAVRFLCGDTDTTNQNITDEEITYLLAEFTDVNSAAAEACMAIAGKYQMKSDTSRSVGDLSISTQYQTTAQNMTKRGMDLRTQASRLLGGAVNFFTDDNGNVFGPMQFRIGMDAYDENGYVNG